MLSRFVIAYWLTEQFYGTCNPLCIPVTKADYEWKQKITTMSSKSGSTEQKGKKCQVIDEWVFLFYKIRMHFAMQALSDPDNYAFDLLFCKISAAQIYKGKILCANQVPCSHRSMLHSLEQCLNSKRRWEPRNLSMGIGSLMASPQRGLLLW